MPEYIMKYAQEYAVAENEYRMSLSKELMRLRVEDNVPVTLAPDIARGNLAQFKYQRDLKEHQWKAAIESSRVIQAEVSALQSILRVQEEV